MVGGGITAVATDTICKAAVAKINLRPITRIMTVGTLTREVVGGGITAMTTDTICKAAVVEIYLLPIGRDVAG
jgi:hypothetical protein